MPRLMGLSLSLGIVLLGSPAFADEKGAPASSAIRWDFDARVGFGAPWTSGQSYLGVGTGIAGGVTFRVPVHLEMGAAYHAGTIESAANRSFVYWSREWSVLAHAAAGYELTMAIKRVVVRPQVVVAGVFIADTTHLGEASRRGLDSFLAMGPGIALLPRFGGFHAGLEAEALFVPSRIAAPIGAVYGVFGVEL